MNPSVHPLNLINAVLSALAGTGTVCRALIGIALPAGERISARASRVADPRRPRSRGVRGTPAWPAGRQTQRAAARSGKHPASRTDATHAGGARSTGRVDRRSSRLRQDDGSRAMGGECSRPDPVGDGRRRRQRSGRAIHRCRRRPRPPSVARSVDIRSTRQPRFVDPFPGRPTAVRRLGTRDSDPVHPR
jgi:hypothetical protein